MNFTQAAHAVGVSKRTGKAQHRQTRYGRNEKPGDRYRSTMDKPKTLHPRHLSLDINASRNNQNLGDL